jgi:hypothetical protein
MQKIKLFKNFLYMVWDHLGLPEPTPLQYDIADWLQFGNRRSITEAFRGGGKSWITSAYVCWLLLNDPAFNILVVSASKDRSDQFTTFTMRLIQEMEILRELRPKSDQRNSKLAFDVGLAPASHAPSVRSVGVMGQMTGGRADVIIADDVEVPNNSDTLTMRLKLQERVKEFDAILKPKGVIRYLGTPQCEDSLYNLLRTRGYVARIWPARYPTAKQEANYHGALAPMISQAIVDNPKLIGKPTEPTRFHEQELLERELSYGRSGFALQFMLDTTLSDADRYPLKLSDLIVMDLNPTSAPTKVIWSNDHQKAYNDLPTVGIGQDRYYRPYFVSDQWADYTGSILVVDPSGRGKDKTTSAVLKVLNGNIFCTKYLSLSGGYEDQNLQILVATAQDQKVNEIVIESNFGDGMFSKLLEKELVKRYPCRITEIRHSTQKEKRIIDTLEPVMNQHKLIIDRKIIEEDYKQYQNERDHQHRLFYQMTRLTKEKGALVHDDGIDVLAMGVAFWNDQIRQDQDTAHQDYMDRMLDEQIEKFDQMVFGTAPRNPNWISR